MIEKEKAIDRILDYINKSENNHINQKDELDFTQNKHIIEIDEYKFKVRELTWKEGLEIDAQSFKKNGKNIYFSSEYEKRNILSKILLEIKDKDDQIVNFKGLSDLDYSYIDKLWVEYQKFLHLSDDEIKFIYNSAKKYFDPNNKEMFALHPLILEVDYITKGIVSFSRNEFEKISIREFETLQLILSTKNELT